MTLRPRSLGDGWRRAVGCAPSGRGPGGRLVSRPRHAASDGDRAARSVGWSEDAGASLFRQNPHRRQNSGLIPVGNGRPGYGTTVRNVCLVRHGHTSFGRLPIYSPTREVSNGRGCQAAGAQSAPRISAVARLQTEDAHPSDPDGGMIEGSQDEDVRPRLSGTRSGASQTRGSPPVTRSNHRMHLWPTSTGATCIIGQPPGITLTPCARPYSTASSATLPRPKDRCIQM